MKTDYILKADILDIIFEKKNKDYGAYPLRKFYHERLYRSLGIIFLVTIILGLFGYYYKNKTGVNIFEIPDTGGATLYEMPEDAPKPPQPPRPPQRQTMSLPSNKENVPVISNDQTTPIDALHDEGKIDNPGDGPNDIVSGDGPPGTGDPKSTMPSTTLVEPVKVIDRSIPVAAEVLPAYPGGIEELRKFLRRNLVTPKDLDPDETISITVEFIVGYDGTLKGFRVTEDGGNAFNDEVIRVLKKMPQWIPGKAHGENVSVYYSIPVKFTSQE